jgi:hypothetical protein
MWFEKFSFYYKKKLKLHKSNMNISLIIYIIELVMETLKMFLQKNYIYRIP